MTAHMVKWLQPEGKVLDWSKGECEPIPEGKTMPNLVPCKTRL